MNKMLNVAFMSLLLLIGVASAQPFSSHWNWYNQRVHGKVKEIISEDKHGNMVEKFNAKGQKTKVEIYGKDSKLRYLITLEYNKVGDLFKVIKRKAKADKPIFVETAEYKAKGIVKSVTRVSNNQTMKSDAFEYDKKKRLKSIMIVNGSESRGAGFEFDKKGKYLGSSIIVEGKAVLKTKVIESEKDYPVTEECYRDGRLIQVSTFEYKFDKYDNWIERNCKYKSWNRIGNEMFETRLTMRKITYYPEE